MIVYLEYGCIALFKNKTVTMFSLKIFLKQSSYVHLSPINKTLGHIRITLCDVRVLIFEHQLWNM